MEFSFFVRGLLIGLSVAAQVGPMSILCIRRTLAQGRMAGFISGLGVASADALYGSIGGFGLTFISSFLVTQQFWLRLIGGLFLCYLGITTWLAKPAERAASAERKTGIVGLYASTFFLTLTNPLTILSFVAILAGLGLGSTGGDYWLASILILGVFIGSMLWWLILTTGVSAFKTRFTPRALGWVNRASGVIIFAFGIVALVGLIF